jgi:hypothetical protein
MHREKLMGQLPIARDPNHQLAGFRVILVKLISFTPPGFPVTTAA